jgi:hydrogenase maturation protease
MARGPHRSLVVGIGNADRGDDGAGRAVARRLRAHVSKDVIVLEHDGEATNLVAKLEGVPAAFIVDACRSGAPAGTVHRLDANQAPLPAAQFGLSTHGLGLATAIELARALSQLPRPCIVYAIEGACFESGAGLSPAVAAAIEPLARRILADLGRAGSLLRRA